MVGWLGQQEVELWVALQLMEEMVQEEDSVKKEKHKVLLFLVSEFKC